jgi:hypothetical protein
VSEPAERPKHLELRASDADRERVAKVLHDAMAEGRLTISELDERLQSVYASKTLGDLVPLTADLPVGAAATMPEQAAPASARIGGTATSTTAVAMMSGFQRGGNWVVPRHFTATALLGGGELDLREARFAERECTISVFAFMGGVEIVVPEDITVRIHGIGMMGGFDSRAAHEGPTSAPVLNVTGFAFLGGVDVKRRKAKPKKNKPRLEG